MNQSLRKSENGFTLLESMIATMILGIAMASALTVMSQGFHYLSDVRRMARSSQVLQQKMEDIRLLNWTQLQAVGTTFTDPEDTAGLYAGTIGQIPFHSYGGTTTVMQVNLAITWTNQNSRIMTNTLSTLVSHGGLNKYIF